MIGVLERAISAAIPPQDSVENPAPGGPGRGSNPRGDWGIVRGYSGCGHINMQGALVEFTKRLWDLPLRFGGDRRTQWRVAQIGWTALCSLQRSTLLPFARMGCPKGLDDSSDYSRRLSAAPKNFRRSGKLRTWRAAKKKPRPGVAGASSFPSEV